MTTVTMDEKYTVMQQSYIEDVLFLFNEQIILWYYLYLSANNSHRNVSKKLGDAFHEDI